MGLGGGRWRLQAAPFPGKCGAPGAEAEALAAAAAAPCTKDRLTVWQILRLESEDLVLQHI